MQIFLESETEKTPAIVSIVNKELSLRHHSPYKEIIIIEKVIIIMQHINNTGSDDQESSPADRYPAVRAKHTVTQN